MVVDIPLVDLVHVFVDAVHILWGWFICLCVWLIFDGSGSHLFMHLPHMFDGCGLHVMVVVHMFMDAVNILWLWRIGLWIWFVCLWWWFMLCGRGSSCVLLVCFMFYCGGSFFWLGFVFFRVVVHMCMDLVHLIVDVVHNIWWWFIC